MLTNIKERFPRLRSVLRRIKIHVFKFRPTTSIFTKIYLENSWETTETASGPGSTLAQTGQIREALPTMLNRLHAKSFLDIPCGDFWWMKEVDLEIENYIGADVVQDLIRKNTEIYGSTTRKFICIDITRDKLPSVDIILCRDLLVHFTYRDIFRAIANIKNSDSKYLLTTTFEGIAKNVDILTGEWRSIDLTMPPFDFPNPIELIDESSGLISPGKRLGLWKISDL
jgi:hypothetical protein